MNEHSRAKILGEYLKSRRNRLQPEVAGFNTSYGHRRTPGLRREEVAILAGVSPTYYTWLEQGREVTASREIMESIGKALQLSTDEYIYLMKLWNPHEPDIIPSINTRLNPQWREIIGQLTYPTFISNERSEILAWNDEAAKRIINFAAWSDAERVMLRLLFIDTDLRSRMVNWEEFARHSVAVFRTYYDKHLTDPWYISMVKQLAEESAEFSAMWELHNIQLKTVNRVYLRSSDSAADTAAYDIHSFMSPTEHPDVHICVYTPVMDTE